jgi:hypothetical protein
MKKGPGFAGAFLFFRWIPAFAGMMLSGTR